MIDFPNEKGQGVDNLSSAISPI